MLARLRKGGEWLAKVVVLKPLGTGAMNWLVCILTE
jgi:hypothetical protein